MNITIKKVKDLKQGDKLLSISQQTGFIGVKLTVFSVEPSSKVWMWSKPMHSIVFRNYYDNTASMLLNSNDEYVVLEN